MKPNIPPVPPADFSPKIVPMTGPAPALTRKDVAQQLAVSLSTIERLIDAGELLAFKIGSQWRIQQRDVDAYVEKARTEQQKRTGTL